MTDNNPSPRRTPSLTGEQLLDLGREIASDSTCWNGTRIDPNSQTRRPLTNIEMHALSRYAAWRRWTEACDVD